MANIIRFGDGEISIPTIGESIIAFDITLSGLYHIEAYDNENFYITYENHRIIGVGFNSTISNNPFIKYTGKLNIIKGVGINTNKEKQILFPWTDRVDSFQDTKNTFDGEGLFFDAIDNTTIIENVPKKIKSKFLNKTLKNINDEGLYKNKNISKVEQKKQRKKIFKIMTRAKLKTLKKTANTMSNKYNNTRSSD